MPDVSVQSSTTTEALEPIRTWRAYRFIGSTATVLFMGLKKMNKVLNNKDYPSTYYTDRDKDLRRLKAYRNEAARLTKITGFKSGNVLDWGCGDGRFSNVLQRELSPASANFWGYDVSSYAIREYIRNGLYDFRNYKAASSPRPTFDLVILRGVLQHLDEPMNDLRFLKESTTKGGYIVILATPDTDSYVYKKFKMLPALDPPRNWMYPSVSMTKNLAERLGLDVVEIVYPYEKPYADPPKDLLNLVKSMLFGYRPFAWPGNMFEMYLRRV